MTGRNVFLIMLMLAIFETPLCAQLKENHFLNTVFIAKRNNVERRYKIGSKFLISYEQGDSTRKVKGYYAGVKEGKLLILPRNSSGTEEFIDPRDILMLRQLHGKQRIVYTAVGAVLTGAGAAILANASDTPGGAVSSALIIPVIGAGVYFLFAVPVSFLIERLNVKKRSNGWVFSMRYS